MIKSKTILFIHGMFMTNECWVEWITYFKEKGYLCYAPSWPYHDNSVENLRAKHPNSSLGKLKLNEVVAFYENLIQEMKEPPILIGHSMGGLIVQILLSHGYGACGIAISSAPPRGVFTLKWSFFKSNLPIINPFKGNKPDWMTFKRFQYAFVNGLSLEDQKKAYENYIVPESRNVPRNSTKKAGYVNFYKKRSPLLLIAGENDHIIPVSLNKKNYNRYKTNSSVTAFKSFEEKNHFIIGQYEWQKIAEYIMGWINKV